MMYSTGGMNIDADVWINVRSGAWEHLSRTLDAERDILVFLWGMNGLQTDPGWTVSVVRRDELPMRTRVVESKLGKFPVAIPQRQHLRKLHGCTLALDDDELVVDIPFEAWISELRLS